MGELREWGKSLGYVIGEFISPGHADRERARNSSSNDDDPDDSDYSDFESHDDDDDDD